MNNVLVNTIVIFLILAALILVYLFFSQEADQGLPTVTVTTGPAAQAGGIGFISLLTELENIRLQTTVLNELTTGSRPADLPDISQISQGRANPFAALGASEPTGSSLEISEPAETTEPIE